MTIESTFSTLGFESVQHQADVVVVGAGGAAMRAAVSAAEQGASVIVVAKQSVGRGGSTVHGASEIMSMGASGFGVAEDNPDVHFRDTMEAGLGFIDPTLVRALAEDAPKRVSDLIRYGVPFDRNPDHSYKLIRSDFGTHARALGVLGKTGAAVVKAHERLLVRTLDERLQQSAEADSASTNAASRVADVPAVTSMSSR